MEVKYTEEKIFTKEQVEELFLSVNWVSGEYPTRLFKALKNSSTVITAWVDCELAGLVRVLDDSVFALFACKPQISGKWHSITTCYYGKGKVQKLPLYRANA